MKGLYIIMTITIPNYTQYQLSTLVRSINPKMPIILDSALVPILDDIIDGKKCFKLKHYQLCSYLLDIDVNTLLSSTDYHENSDKDPEIDKFIKNSQRLFAEFINQENITGKVP